MTLSLLCGVAGLAHLVAPEAHARLTPAAMPWPETVAFLTGIRQLLNAIALHLPPLRAAAGLLLVLYALCVWPANSNHAAQGF
ncbi:MAG: hypothetical protein NT037_12605 [Hyphomicrobiales bacterium]|nr:hypothetical protein [Hyphomicrobiales bacterium]